MDKGSLALRIKLYPEPQMQIRREIHAPCRNRKLRGEGLSDKYGETFFLKYEITMKRVDEFLRYYREHVKTDSVTEVIDLEKEADIVDLIQYCEEEKETASVTEVIGLGKDAKNDKVGSVQKVELVSELEDAGRTLKTLAFDPDDDDDFVSPVRKMSESVKIRLEKLRRINLESALNEKKLAKLLLLHPVEKSDDKDNVFIEAFAPLTNEEKEEVSRAFSLYDRRKVLVTHKKSNIGITGAILQSLRPGGWLNDKVIEVYFELLKEREQREPKKYLKCHFFNTFFLEKLIGGKNGYDYKSVRRWTTQEKLGYSLSECEKIFVPIHKQAYWCLAIINKKDKKFQYLDSLGRKDPKVLRILAKYFKDEVKDKNGVKIDVASWTREDVEDIPRQKNGSDSGMFMIKYADFYSRKLRLCFDQEHMPYFRVRTAKEILKLEAK